MALPFYHSRRLHSRRSSVYVYLVAFKAIQEFFSQPYTPPVTLGLIGLMTLLHLRPGTLDYSLPSISQVCLNPALVVEVSASRVTQAWFYLLFRPRHLPVGSSAYMATYPLLFLPVERMPIYPFNASLLNFPVPHPFPAVLHPPLSDPQPAASRPLCPLSRG